MIKLKTGSISFGVHQLLYARGLSCYLQNFRIWQSKASEANQQPPKLPQNQQTDCDLNLLYIQEGDECFHRGQYQNAILKYNQALDIETSADTYYQIGLSHHQTNNYQLTILDYSRAISYRNDSKAYQKKAEANYQLGNYQEAIKDYTQAISINPCVAITYQKRAEARYRLGDKQGAIEDYSQAMRINPDLA